MENGYTAKTIFNRAPVEGVVYKLLIRADFEYFEEGQKFWSVNTKQIYEMIADLPVSLKLLFYFSK